MLIFIYCCHVVFYALVFIPTLTNGIGRAKIVLYSDRLPYFEQKTFFFNVFHAELNISQIKLHVFVILLSIFSRTILFFINFAGAINIILRYG